MTQTDRESVEQELIDYLDSEAEHEIECAQEMTDLAKTLRRLETTARRLVRERDALLDRAEAANKVVQIRRGK